MMSNDLMHLLRAVRENLSSHIREFKETGKLSRATDAARCIGMNDALRVLGVIAVPETTLYPLERVLWRQGGETVEKEELEEAELQICTG